MSVKIIGKNKPIKATTNSAGYDIKANLSEDLISMYTARNEPYKRPIIETADNVRGVWVGAGERVMVPTGLTLEIEDGYWVGLYPRSGLSIKHGINLVNGVGVIDSDYKGEVMILLVNVSDGDYFLKDGERICQMIVHKCYDINEAEVVPKKRGRGGFGSTGE